MFDLIFNLIYFKVDLEPGDRTRSLGDSADSDTPTYRTFFFSNFQNFVTE